MSKLIHISLAIAALGVACVVRIYWLEFRSADMDAALLGWYDYLALGTGIDALSQRVGTYSPPYLYLLALSTHLRENFWPELSKVAAVKLPSLLLDAIAAGIVFALVRRIRSAISAFWAAAAVLLAPSVWLNSGVWGQCDMLHSALIFASVLALLDKKRALAMFVYGIAIAVKAQALFVAPLFLYLLLRREIKLAHVPWVIAGFVSAMLPAMLVGAPARATIFAYFGQADEFRSLALLAPNLYGLVSDTYLEFGTNVGLIAAAIAAVTLGWRTAQIQAPVSAASIFQVLTFSAVLMPFLLPRMHERYWFVADVASIVLAFYRPRFAWAAILIQMASTHAVLRYIELTAPGLLPTPPPIPFLGGWLNLAVLLGLLIDTMRRSGTQRGDIAIAAAGFAAALAVLLIAPNYQQTHPGMSLGTVKRTQQPLRINFGGELEIYGLERVEDQWLRGRTYAFRIDARALRPLTREYAFHLELLDTHGRSLGLAQTVVPDLPTTRWTPGHLFVQPILFPIWPLTAAPTETVIHITLYERGQPVLLDTRCDDQPCASRAPFAPIVLNKDDTRPFSGRALGRFGEQLDLMNADVLLENRQLRTTLIWRSLQRAPQGSALIEFVHVIDPFGKLIGQSDGPINDDRFQAALWQRNQFIPSTRVLALPDSLAPGEYSVVAGLYRRDTVQRLPISAADTSATNDVLVIKTITIR